LTAGLTSLAWFEATGVMGGHSGQGAPGVRFLVNIRRLKSGILLQRGDKDTDIAI
jgi:hypothetical protein